jgi:hypothetical protein
MEDFSQESLEIEGCLDDGGFFTRIDESVGISRKKVDPCEDDCIVAGEMDSWLKEQAKTCV